MTPKYCASTASCGSYQPSEPGNFNLENLVDNIEDKLDWKQWLLAYLQTGGQYASIIVVLVWTEDRSQTPSPPISEEPRVHLENSPAVELQPLHLSSQVRDSLLRTAPTNTILEDSGARPIGEMGTLVLST